MTVHHGWEHLPRFKNPVLTIGMFDGVHPGHLALIQQVIQRAQEIAGESILVTFEPHPRLVLLSQTHPLELLTTLEEKIAVFNTMAIDHLVVIPFTKAFADWPAKDYVQNFIQDKFHPRLLIIGYDHRFGHNREGDIQLLQQLKTECDFELEEIPAQMINEIAVSSTKIRHALHTGNIEQAGKLLGRTYTLGGHVIYGQQRGRLLGFPTANLLPEHPHKLVPANGVYAVYVWWKEQRYNGMLNIGVRPTFEKPEHRSIEVHLFDFHQNLYEEKLMVSFVSRLRDERKFDSPEALQHQLTEDSRQALRIL